MKWFLEKYMKAKDLERYDYDKTKFQDKNKPVFIKLKNTDGETLIIQEISNNDEWEVITDE